MISLKTLFALSLAAGLPAAVIDGNYTPGSFTYPGSLGAFGSGPTQMIGQQFTVTGGPWDNIGIHLPLFVAAGTNLVNVLLLDDDGGLPGLNVLANFSLLIISAYQTDLNPPGLILNPGSYWLTVSAGATDTEVRWYNNDTGVTSGTSPSAIYNNGWTNLPGNFTAAAYQITGDSLATVSPTPEPGTFLVGLAAVGALALRRRRSIQ